MKKVLASVSLIAFLTMAIGFTSCKSKPKDADIQTAVETAMKADPMAANTTVSVTDGVVTIAGECKDDMCKAHCGDLAKGITGVKNVVNNCTVAPPPPPPASLTTTLDDATMQKVKDGLKDIKGITSLNFSDKGAVIVGEISSADNMKIKQMLASAKVLLDAAASKITIKK